MAFVDTSAIFFLEKLLVWFTLNLSEGFYEKEIKIRLYEEILLMWICKGDIVSNKIQYWKMCK